MSGDLKLENERLRKDLQAVMDSKDYWRGLASHEREHYGELCEFWRDVFCDIWPYLPIDFCAEFEKETREAVEGGKSHEEAWRVLAAIHFYENVRKCRCESCLTTAQPDVAADAPRG